MALKKIAPESANRITALVIGQAGIGKTSLLRTIPETDSITVISAESGLLCVRDLVESGRVTGYEAASFSDLREIMAELKSLSEPHWLFIDSLTEIASRCSEELARVYPDKKDSFSRWNDYNDRMTLFIKAFRDFVPHHVVFTCLDDKESDDLKRVVFSPEIQGKGLKSRLTSYFDEVFYMTLNKDAERVFVTQPISYQYAAKDRSGKLASIESPNLAAIKSKILGKEN